MHKGDPIWKQIIQFNTLAAFTNWDASALAWAFKRGLVACIKDELARISPEPVTLGALRREVQRIDNRYWRREEEKKRDAARSQPQAKKEGKKSTSTNNPSSSNSSPNSPKPANTSPQSQTQSNNNKSSTSNKSSSNKKSYVDKLGANGRLSEAEYKRRKENGLCMFCGAAGHKVSECRKRKAAEASRTARSATTETTTTNIPATNSSAPESSVKQSATLVPRYKTGVALNRIVLTLGKLFSMYLLFQQINIHFVYTW